MTRRRILQVKDMYSRMRMGDLATKVGKTGAGGSQEVTAVLNEMVSHRVPSLLRMPAHGWRADLNAKYPCNSLHTLIIRLSHCDLP